MLLKSLFEAIERTGQGSTAVIGWGRGMGHKGHMMLASSVITHAKELGGDPYFVVSRTVGKDDPITPEEKLAIYKKVFPKQGHIFQSASDELPDLTRVLANLNQQGYNNAVVVVGSDQVKAFQYLKNYNGKPDKSGNIAFKFDNLDVISRQETNDPSAGEEGPRATPMRQVLNDLEAFRKEHPQYNDVPDSELPFSVWRDAMSPEISDDEVRDLMTKAKERMNAFGSKKTNKVQELKDRTPKKTWADYGMADNRKSPQEKQYHGWQEYEQDVQKKSNNHEKKNKPVGEESAGVGVIASKKQAKDPRYSMSLTRDVRPGQVKKNLKAFSLAEDKNEPAVRAIQSYLNKKGANLDVDGKFGPLTKKSIEKYMPKANTELAPEPNKTTSVQGKKSKEQGVAEEGGKNPHTSALGKALYRDLSKEKKASPAQVQRNKERWAKRQAEREQDVAEEDSKAMAHTAKSLENPPKVMQHRAKRDQEREQQLKYRDIAKRNDESVNSKLVPINESIEQKMSSLIDKLKNK